MVPHAQNRSGRRARALAAGAVAASVVLGVAGCGSGSGVRRRRDHHDRLGGGARHDAGQRGRGLRPGPGRGHERDDGHCHRDPRSERTGGEPRTRVEAQLTRLDAAASAMRPLQLDDATVDAQRKDLLAAIPPFDTAMRAVVAAGQKDPVNGGLELVQQRDPILAGVDAALAADAGAITALGDTARAALTTARQELQRQLSDLRTQAAG